MDRHTRNCISLFETWLIDNEKTIPYKEGTILEDKDGKLWRVTGLSKRDFDYNGSYDHKVYVLRSTNERGAEIRWYECEKVVDPVHGLIIVSREVISMSKIVDLIEIRDYKPFVREIPTHELIRNFNSYLREQEEGLLSIQ